MKKIILTILISSIFLLTQSQNWLDNVVLRADNNYVSYYDTISLREKTPENIKEKLKLYFEKYQMDTLIFFMEHLEYEKNNIIFRISFSKNIDLYVVKYCSFNCIDYFFWGYDKWNDELSLNPYQINGKWIENNERGFIRKLNTSPLLFFDNNLENKYNIVLSERVHNGTSYNAIVNHYLLLDKDMNFNLLFCIEIAYQYASPEIDENIDAIINRTYNQGKISCTLSIDNQKEINIGNFEIDIDNQNIKNKNIFNFDYVDYLITGSGIDENLFLKNGYNTHCK